MDVFFPEGVLKLILRVHDIKKMVNEADELYCATESLKCKVDRLLFQVDMG